jgi:hypothetical protein
LKENESLDPWPYVYMLSILELHDDVRLYQ